MSDHDPRLVARRLLRALGVHGAHVRRVVVTIAPHEYPTIDVHRTRITEHELTDLRAASELADVLERYELRPRKDR